MPTRSKHTLGAVKRAGDGVFVVVCTAGDFSYASPAASVLPDIELRKDVAYEAIARHCIDAWREEGRI